MKEARRRTAKQIAVCAAVICAASAWLEVAGAENGGPPWRRHLEQAERLAMNGDVVSARHEYQQAIVAAATSEDRSEARTALADLVLADGLPVGPILAGAARSVHILTPSVTSRGILNMSAVAAVGAQHQAARTPRML